MKFPEAARLQKIVLPVSFLLLLSGCVESKVEQREAIVPDLSQEKSSSKIDFEAFEKGLEGTWMLDCGLTDSQKVIWTFDGERFQQHIKIYLEKGCPESSIAAEYKAGGYYHFGKMMVNQSDAVEFDYVQESYSLTIRHSVYLNAYNGTREYGHLQAYCKGFKFERNVETSLVGKHCLEGDNDYQKIHANSVFYSALRLEQGTMYEARYTALNDGTAPNKRPLGFNLSVGYQKQSEPGQLTLSRL
ncbi:hypothetical protein [Pseudobacteriovorax antillogorgiicola]|uniref:Uncharacterized protein n=1 Tax=Pseudobacteriovorax antillogorgiicola TaxID=1513793 RepID=A0A1Y6C713_9BACT|nr:hypothetical protein [Pseudobacteriovorax antillogorgiicola]TCS49369.1 hypothetical protein EDD56_11549 [Pseudobacteriovorax antillogorgiicola]SMF47443.1 hypothetical protein SAMN06296036_114135 [Pseudobacteriovorax antillogorgiicola]